MDIHCQYCGKRIARENDTNVKKKIAGHLTHCRVRRAGVEFAIGSDHVNVKARSIRCVNDLKQTMRDMEHLPAETQKAVFLGILMTEQKYKKVKEFNFH